MSFSKREWQRKDRDAFKAKFGYSKCIHYRFGGNREAALQRDNHSCVKCGMNDAEHKAKWNRPITVDHKDRNDKNNALENLQTLCLSCHGRKDLLPRLREQKVPLKKSEILSLRADGKTYEEIIAVTGFSLASLSKWINRWNKEQTQ